MQSSWPLGKKNERHRYRISNNGFGFGNANGRKKNLEYWWQTKDKSVE